MSMTVPTVRIKGVETDYIVINESDFDASKHELYEEAPAAKVEEPKKVEVSSVEEVKPAIPVAPVAPWTAA